LLLNCLLFYFLDHQEILFFLLKRLFEIHVVSVVDLIQLPDRLLVSLLLNIPFLRKEYFLFLWRKIHSLYLRNL